MKSKIFKIVLSGVFLIAIASLSFAGNMSQNKLTLKKGWNLVGSVLNNVQMNEAFSQNYINSVWKWDTDSNSWELFSPDENVQELMNKYQLKKMSNVNSGQGFWINSSEDAELYINGEPPQVTSLLSASSVDTDFAENMDSMDNESEINPDQVKPLMSQLIANAELKTYSGEVVAVPQIGTKSMNGFQIQTDEGEITLYGLGPVKIWDSAEVDRPVAGDNITVDVLSTTLDDGSVRNILVKLTDSDGNSLQLRDETTGLPVWAKGKMGLNKNPETGEMQKKQYKWGKGKFSSMMQ